MAWITVSTDNDREVIGRGETREESIMDALTMMDLPDGYSDYDEWLRDLESHPYGTPYEALGIATMRADAE